MKRHSNNNRIEIIYILGTMAIMAVMILTFLGMLFVNRLSLLNMMDTLLSNMPFFTFTQVEASIIRLVFLLLIVFGGAYAIFAITGRICIKIGDRVIGNTEWRTPVLSKISK